MFYFFIIIIQLETINFYLFKRLYNDKEYINLFGLKIVSSDSKTFKYYIFFVKGYELQEVHLINNEKQIKKTFVFLL